jgi:hypothetical protein
MGILGTSKWLFAALFGLSIFTAYQWLHERQNHWIYLVQGGVISLIYAFLLSPFSWPFVFYIGLGILVFTYEKGIKWRNIPFLKPIVISISWFALGIGIPKIAIFGEIPYSDFLHLLLFFVLAFVEDFVDMSTDRGHIKTIPLYLSKSVNELFIVSLLFVYFVMSSWILPFNAIWKMKLVSLTLTCSPLFYLIYLKKSPKISHRYFDFILFVIGLLHLLVENIYWFRIR